VICNRIAESIPYCRFLFIYTCAEMSNFLGGEKVGLADLALFSAVKQLGLDR
jgi:hypothetical protein